MITWTRVQFRFTVLVATLVNAPGHHGPDVDPKDGARGTLFGNWSASWPGHGRRLNDPRSRSFGYPPGYPEGTAFMIMGQRWRYPPKMTHDHGSPRQAVGRRWRKGQVSEICQSRITGPDRPWVLPPRSLSGESVRPGHGPCVPNRGEIPSVPITSWNLRGLESTRPFRQDFGPWLTGSPGIKLADRQWRG